MFMVRKRLRNGQSMASFVSSLWWIKRLRKIKVGDEYLRVFIAYDRRSTCNRNLDRREMNGRRGNTLYKGVCGGGPRMNTRDIRRYVDVVHGGYVDVVHGVNSHDKEFNRRSKKGCYLSKLVVFCEEQGLKKVEVKFLGGFEVMVVDEVSFYTLF
nr:transposon TX1 [Tanacetum cinerariifolium]